MVSEKRGCSLSNSALGNLHVTYCFLLHVCDNGHIIIVILQGGLWQSLGANIKLNQDDLWLAHISAAVPGRAAVTLVPSVEEGV